MSQFMLILLPMRYSMRSLLSRVLLFISRDPQKKMLKSLIGSGRLYRFAVRLYIVVQTRLKGSSSRNFSRNIHRYTSHLDSSSSAIYVDITSLARFDAGGGIQRTQKMFLQSASKLFDTRVIPIASSGSNFYKVQFDLEFLSTSYTFKTSSEKVILQRDDIFFSLDLNYLSLISNFDYYLRLSNQGTRIWFLIYDLLPISYPDYFPDGIPEMHSAWLNNLLKIANVICISKTVQGSLERYINEHRISRTGLSNIQVYLGSDLMEKLVENSNRPRNEKKPKLIAVGTLEPRKGYEDILFVCEKLWSVGHVFELHFIGKKGWKSNSLIEKVEKQIEKNIDFFWHYRASDEELFEHYATCDALIAASFDEGYGLPIVEAMSRGKEVFARKIEVFQEILGSHKNFFETVDELELKLITFLKSTELETPGTNRTPTRTWLESTQEIIDSILKY